ncbi:hypothetical protein AOQ84DRAFT_356060 [Glonium stellatum]|uniref:Uncharacterized protein n=1 Tax=Glonium stellatum TaxID=574774 RepID=A0A8E2EUT3_9PEZI|nr:hypothetical protein AOQ84DRAFT_356060 [Glonium stellatum]
MHSNILTILALAATALARTDLSGCTSSETVAFGGASMIYYVPGTGEICAFLDCGGGTAPPKTTVPGCPLYSGTASYEPSYLSGYGPNAVVSTAMVSSIAAETTMVMTAAPTALSSALPGITVIDSSSALSVSSSGSSFATITTAPGQSTILVGTGGISATGTGAGNNLTATATLPTTTSHFTGAATALAAGKEMFGLAVGVVAAGLAVL